MATCDHFMSWVVGVVEAGRIASVSACRGCQAFLKPFYFVVFVLTRGKTRRVTRCSEVGVDVVETLRNPKIF